MQQRRLRLGDIVDDYCPRERRVTNHAIVAMIEDEVKQTRCTTCDADHEYKHGRIPAQRRKKESPAGPGDAIAAVPRRRMEIDEPADAVDSTDAVDFNDVSADESLPPPSPSADVEHAPLQASEAPAAADAFEPGESTEPAPVEDEGPVHRRLIRATLPRPEGQTPERKLPEFTMHQREVNGNRAGRGGHRRGPRPGQMRAQGNGQPTRFGGPRQGPRHGSGQSGQGDQGQRHQGQNGQHGQSGQHGQQGQPRRRKRRR